MSRKTGRRTNKVVWYVTFVKNKQGELQKRNYLIQFFFGMFNTTTCSCQDFTARTVFFCCCYFSLFLFDLNGDGCNNLFMTTYRAVRPRKSCLNTVLSSGRRETNPTQLAAEHQARGSQRFKQSEEAFGLLQSPEHVDLQDNFNEGRQRGRKSGRRRKRNDSERFEWANTRRRCTQNRSAQGTKPFLPLCVSVCPVGGEGLGVDKFISVEKQKGEHVGFSSEETEVEKARFTYKKESLRFCLCCRVNCRGPRAWQSRREKVWHAKKCYICRFPNPPEVTWSHKHAGECKTWAYREISGEMPTRLVHKHRQSTHARVHTKGTLSIVTVFFLVFLSPGQF